MAARALQLSQDIYLKFIMLFWLRRINGDADAAGTARRACRIFPGPSSSFLSLAVRGFVEDESENLLWEAVILNLR